MTVGFEVRQSDGAARLGDLPVPGFDQPIETPALLPVINPNITMLSAADIVDEFDPEVLITNAYVIYQSDELKSKALSEGVHGLLDVDLPVMTDSGSFQLAEYGSISVGNDEIVTFQSAIGSNIVTPVDLPTPPDAPRSVANEELSTTISRIEAAREHIDTDRLLSGPVQGGGYHELRHRAGMRARQTGADIYPIGAVVPLMEAYRFDTLVDVVVASKRGLGPDAPVHLFGAGHPMMFALAAALGCDLFDSAAYALYARDGRYLTPTGTYRMDEIDFLPCACPICAQHDAVTLAGNERLLARHNLHVSFAEVRQIKQAIRQGSLFELLDIRARSHPDLLDGYRRLLQHDTFLERHDRAIKSTFMYVSAESAHRPEVNRHHWRLRDWTVEGDVLLASSGIHLEGRYDVRWEIRPPFGPVPPGLDHTYPLSAEIPDRLDTAAYEQAVEGIRALSHGSTDAHLTLAHGDWPATALDRLPDAIETVRVE